VRDVLFHAFLRISKHEFPSTNSQASISRHEFHFLFYGRCLSLHIYKAAMTPPIIGIIGIIGNIGIIGGAWQCMMQ
jgi:hypothetical protein